MLLDVEISEHMLKEEETVVIGVVESRCIVEDSHIRVNHLVITNEEKGRCIYSILTVGFRY